MNEEVDDSNCGPLPLNHCSVSCTLLPSQSSPSTPPHLVGWIGLHAPLCRASRLCRANIVSKLPLEIHHLLYSCLDDKFGTLVAREHRDVEGRARDTAREQKIEKHISHANRKLVIRKRASISECARHSVSVIDFCVI